MLFSNEACRYNNQEWATISQVYGNVLFSSSSPW